MKYIRHYQTQITELYHSFPSIKEEFLRKIIKQNILIIYTTAIICLCIESSNIIRVLNSNAKLSTLNNRIYFFFYIALFVASLTPLILRFRWPKKPKQIYTLQIIYAVFHIYWNLFLNSYTLSRAPYGSTLIFSSALIFTSILFRAKLLHIISIQIISYLSFIIINTHTISWSDRINITITALVSIFSAILIYIQEVHLTQTQIMLEKTNMELQDREYTLTLSIEKNQFIMAETNLFSFDWDLRSDVLTPSRNCSETLGWPPNIVHPRILFREQDSIFRSDYQSFVELLNRCLETKKRGSTDLRLKNYTQDYIWYRLQLFVQCDKNDTAISITGILLNIDGSTRLIQNLNQQLHTHIEGTKQYLEQLKDSQEQTSIYRHDMRHSLKLMEQLALQGNMEKLCSYLAETHSKLESITPNYYCENETVNVILGSFEELAHKQEIAFVTDVTLPPDLSISDTDLCALLFNLLENAMTAASKVSDLTLRTVQIRSVYTNNKLLIFTENGYIGAILVEDELPISPYSTDGHGFGIKSIVHIVEQYNGLYSFETENKKFYAKILLEM